MFVHVSVDEYEFVPESTAITIISSCVLVALVAPQSPRDSVCVSVCGCASAIALTRAL